MQEKALKKAKNKNFFIKIVFSLENLQKIIEKKEIGRNKKKVKNIGISKI